MSKQTKITFGIIVGAVFAVFLLALVAVGAYALGRNSAAEQTEPVLVPAQALNSNESIPASPTESESTPDGIAAVADDNIEQEDDSDQPTDVPDPTAEPIETDESSSDQEVLEAPDVDSDDLDLLIEVWDIVGDSFDGSFPSEEAVIYSAIAGSLEILDDQHTRFVPEHVAEQLREQLDGSFEGIGAFVEMNDDGFLVIVRPMEDRPADLAGIKSGDIITHVDGEPVQGKLIDEVIAAVKGPEGTEVTLTIQRESEPEPLIITVVRALIVIPIVESEILEESVAYVRLTSFNGIAEEQLSVATEELLETNPVGLIFDLRDNPGGFLNQAVSVADLFLADGIILYERNNMGEEEIFRADDGELGESIPLVVLVNAGSASAAEIVAGAIQDNDRAILIGDQTFGKGSVQQSHVLSDGSELRVTIARWYTPANVSIDKGGITPDLFVETPDEFNTENDTQLQRAIDYLLEGE